MVNKKLVSIGAPAASIKRGRAYSNDRQRPETILENFIPTGLNFQDRNSARAAIQIRITSTAATIRAALHLAAIYPINTQYRWLSFTGYYLFS